MWGYTTENEANEVLEYYEDYFFRSPYIKYIAVIQKEATYEIDIGVTQEGKVKIDNCIDLFSAYLGQFPSNIIPGRLPVPSSFDKVIRIFPKSKDGIRKGMNEIPIPSIKTHLQTISKFSFKGIIEQPFITNEMKTEALESSFKKELKWLEYPLSSMPIKTTSYINSGQFTGEGTLGGIFKLIGHPGELFGITNWHVASGLGKAIGDKIYSHPDNQEIGDIFWHKLDIFREAAIIRFDPCIAELLRTKMKNDKEYHSFEIGTPEINMNLIHMGYGTFIETGKPATTEIISKNTTIRIPDTLYGTQEIRTFKNQLLVKECSTNGDSGSVLYTHNGKKLLAIGLIFGRSSFHIRIENENSKNHANYTIANNLNTLLNHTFPDKQEFYIDSVDNRRIPGLTSEFIINHN